ncbi:type I restriction enzyme, S subunit [Marinobacterium lutimaris]|uniref:Type I restriction enzyme, S subunit n=1 Tax=Marinobacterium lutimaris TaxID=568106 RepID=A0A1H5VPB4_9GAMM|nr:type I restriction enzyme, S subunit [Marinobacterium lutimaris]
MTEEFERYTFGATIKTIGMDDVKSLRAAIPPLQEQSKISDQIFKRLRSIDKSIEKADAFVSLLQERRTVLISAAVTGKIDVRNFKAGDTDAA